jgi:hypothetical protein
MLTDLTPVTTKPIRESGYKEHRWVTVTEIKDYIYFCRQQAAGSLPPSFNHWLGRQAYFGGELVSLDLRRTHFAEACFNGATLRYCRLGGYWKGAQFINATWDHVTIANGAILDDVSLDGLTLKCCQFQTITPLRLSMQSAKVSQSNLAGLHIVGQLKLEGTLWDAESYQTLPLNLQAQLQLLKQQKMT